VLSTVESLNALGTQFPGLPIMESLIGICPKFRFFMTNISMFYYSIMWKYGLK